MQFWDGYHDIYNKFLITSPSYNELVSGVTFLIKKYIKIGDTILDSGCGSGMLADKLAQEGYELTAVDNSTKALLLLRRRNPSITIHKADLLKGLSFPDKYFQGIVSINTLYTFTEDEIFKILKEYSRVLKDNGVVVLSDPCEGFSNMKIFFNDIKEILRTRKLINILVHILRNTINYLPLLFFNKIIDFRAYKKVYSYFDEEQYVIKLEKAGFSILKSDKIYAKQNNMLVVKHKTQHD